LVTSVGRDWDRLILEAPSLPDVPAVDLAAELGPRLALKSWRTPVVITTAMSQPTMTTTRINQSRQRACISSRRRAQNFATAEPPGTQPFHLASIPIELHRRMTIGSRRLYLKSSSAL
jgi:hypothetical protein